jgi:hypothetical protein
VSSDKKIDTYFQEGRVNHLKVAIQRVKNGFRWERMPSPASLFEEPLEILPSRDLEGLTVDPPEQA